MRRLALVFLLLATLTLSAGETATGILQGAGAALFDLLRGQPHLYHATCVIGTPRDPVQARFETLLRERYGITLLSTAGPTAYVRAYNVTSAHLLSVRHGRGFYRKTWCDAKGVTAQRR